MINPVTADSIPISPCPGPASAPRTKVPSGATDCHFHIFGSQDHYPLSAQTRYVPAEASVEAYRTLARTLGIERMVVVQPSPYGTDNRCTLDALRAFGLERARGVAVVGPDVSDVRLQEMHAGGIRGIRINAVTGGVPLSELDGLVSRIAPMGWHLQLFISHELLPKLEHRLRRLPLPVVIDHMGQVPVSKGIESAQFQCLLRLLEAKNIWVKLCGYRVSEQGPPYDDLLAPAQALIAAAPDRTVWGTDWPHPFLEGRAMPDAGKLLDLLSIWAKDTKTLTRILADNPARLYGL